ncbi:MAG TPA: cellulase N-terminal Ig-like domain-containing protein, partial [Fibrobacteria bacterium]|nr:cellulase N-terminal Ig-like domain-containing protein [Fibrobacteria bacterium]
MPIAFSHRHLFTGISLCVAAASHPVSADVLANHLGWPVKSHKTVLLTAGSQATAGATWTLAKANGGGTVASGTVGAAQGWPLMGNDMAQVVVLPDSLEPGSYKLTAGSAQLDFQVQEQPWLEVSKALLKGFYFQRAGMELTSAYAGAWARPAAHVDGMA